MDAAELKKTIKLLEKDMKKLGLAGAVEMKVAGGKLVMKGSYKNKKQLQNVDKLLQRRKVPSDQVSNQLEWRGANEDAAPAQAQEEEEEASEEESEEEEKEYDEDEEFVFFFKDSPFLQSHPCKFSGKGLFGGGQQDFISTEQWALYNKAMLFNAESVAERILAATSAPAIRKLGKAIKNVDKEQWEEEKEAVVLEGSRLKFTQDPKLYELLVATAPKTLAMASPTGKVWGIGLEEGDPRALDRRQWLGANLLGEILTQLRDDLVQASTMRDQNAADSRDDRYRGTKARGSSSAKRSNRGGRGGKGGGNKRGGGGKRRK
mmetsp:Transcript_1648/g.5850  ORF Transcript_1648/g.5850 Transcript_1648/m.5850 type:complete len:319 (-) Transcript_1648:23-979(-)